MHLLNTILQSNDKKSIKDIPKKYLLDPLFLANFFSNRLNDEFIHNVNEATLELVAPYILINNPMIFFLLPNSIQTLSNFEISLGSVYNLNIDNHSHIEYLSKLKTGDINIIFNQNHENIDFSWNLSTYEKYFDQFKHNDYFIRSYCNLLINKNKNISKSIWESRDVTWWTNNREVFSHNIKFPNFSLTNKYFYDLSNTPEEYLTNVNFALTLAVNSYEIIESLPVIVMNEENSIKLLGIYLYYQEHEKFPSLELSENIEFLTKIMENFIFSKEQSSFFSSCEYKIISSIEKRQLYISDLLSPFFKKFTYEEIKNHPYWNNNSLNHIGLLTTSYFPSYNFIKSFNSTVKLHLLIDTVTPLFNTTKNLNISFCSNSTEYVNLFRYILQKCVINDQTLEDEYNLDIDNNREYIIKCYDKYLKPLLENDYLDYHAQTNEKSSKNKKMNKF